MKIGEHPSGKRFAKTGDIASLVAQTAYSRENFNIR